MDADTENEGLDAEATRCLAERLHDGPLQLLASLTPDRLRPFENCGFGLWSIDQRLREIDGHMEFDNDAGLCAKIVLPAGLLEA